MHAKRTISGFGIYGQSWMTWSSGTLHETEREEEEEEEE
jgi:hypothetical protein